jgi:hypothetical protein
MLRQLRTLALSLAGLVLLSVPAAADDLDTLARDFWAWRARQMPISGDDIPRLTRPAGWTGDWSPAAVAGYRRELLAFEGRWRRLDHRAAPVPLQVDYRLMGSAISRVRWELEITRGWQRNPWFYLNQTLGAVFLLLLPPPPFDDARGDSILRALEHIPQHVASAKANLRDARAQWAVLALEELKDVRPNLAAMARALKPLLPAGAGARLDAATETATAALEDYRAWLHSRLPAMGKQVAVGRAGYEFFLRNVALIPYTPEQLVAMAQQEWRRAVAFEVYESHRNAGLPPLPMFPDQAAQIAAEAQREAQIRRFLEEKNILTVPAWMRHYRNLPLPAYLEPLRNLGVHDDLTGPDRLNEDAISYIPEPGPGLGYFSAASARDPRPILVHEGVPGHYFQLALSWEQPNLIRRRYYDSGANEGIGLYGEEMMLQAGLFDDQPKTREIIYNFMRLRALRVEVDVKLALGEFTIEQAAEYFVKNVPMDRETALGESAFYASDPGLAIAYQMGKLQITQMLAEARRQQGERFDLRAFHDSLWRNGNVPLALLRWETLGLTDQLTALDAGRPTRGRRR